MAEVKPTIGPIKPVIRGLKSSEPFRERLQTGEWLRYAKGGKAGR